MEKVAASTADVLIRQITARSCHRVSVLGTFDMLSAQALCTSFRYKLHKFSLCEFRLLPEFIVKSESFIFNLFARK